MGPKLCSNRSHCMPPALPHDVRHGCNFELCISLLGSVSRTNLGVLARCEGGPIGVPYGGLATSYRRGVSVDDELTSSILRHSLNPPTATPWRVVRCSSRSPPARRGRCCRTSFATSRSCISSHSTPKFEKSDERTPSTRRPRMLPKASTTKDRNITGVLS